MERGFRINKHDLKVRPIHHWTPRRIRAHLALAYMAFACVQHLVYRIKLQKKRPLSPEAIRDALMARQCSILKHVRKPDRYVVPAPRTVEAELIYDALGLKFTDVPYALK